MIKEKLIIAIAIVVFIGLFAGYQVYTNDNISLPFKESTTISTTQESTSTTKKQTTSTTKATTSTTEYDIQIPYSFRNAEYLREHFNKHGNEMGYNDEYEYLDGANAVIYNPKALHKTEAEDGDDVYYLESTDEFVVVSTDGYIRTYFICSGKSYFDKQ